MSACEPTAAPGPGDGGDDDALVTRYSAFRYVVAALYYLLSAWVLFLLWRVIGRRGAGGRRWQTAFYGFVAAASLGRGVYFTIQPAIYDGSIDLRNCVNALLSVVPSLFFFSAYLVLLFFWCAAPPWRRWRVRRCRTARGSLTRRPFASRPSSSPAA